MPSYTSYMRQMAVLDADDNEIESWITVRGNHIPIKKGQSKEDAVKSFIEKKGGSGGKINTNIDPNREKAGKTKYDPSDDFATQLYKNKKSKGDYTIAHKDKSGNTTIIAEVSHHDISEGSEKKEHNTEGLYQDALNDLDEQIADKEKELENIHLSMTENAEAGYFDIASANMEDIEFVKGQLEELKKKREKLAGSSQKNPPKVTKVDAKKWNSPASDPWKSLYD